MNYEVMALCELAVSGAIDIRKREFVGHSAFIAVRFAFGFENENVR